MSKAAAAALMSLMGSSCSCPEPMTLEQHLNKRWLYCGDFKTDRKDSDGDPVKGRIGVNDARIGASVFRDTQGEDCKREFVKWFEDTNEAIEFAVDLVREERAKYPQ